MSLLPLLALLLGGQGVEAATPYDRVLTLEITGEEPVLLEGRGPTVIVEYPVEFDGLLHLWARSEADLCLRVDEVTTWEGVWEDDNSDGGESPYVRIDARAGHHLIIQVAGVSPGVEGALELFLVAAPDTDDTRMAARRGQEAIREARRLGEEGRAARARDRIRSAVEEALSTNSLGSNQQLAETLTQLGFAAQALGDVETNGRAWMGARAYFEHVLPPGHYDLFRARKRVARVAMERGDFAESRALLEEALAEASPRRDDPEWLAAEGSLAAVLLRMGDYGAARILAERVIERLESVVPEDHLYLLIGRGNLAVVKFMTGDLAGARGDFEQILEQYRRTLGKDDPELLSMKNNLSAILLEYGDAVAARSLQESVLRVLRETLPPDHPDLIVTRLQLARSLHAIGDLSGARALLSSIVESCERTLAEEHPYHVGALGNLAAVLTTEGKHDQGYALRARVVQILERSLPEGHPGLLKAKCEVAKNLLLLGELEKASELQEEALRGYESMFPAYHPDRRNGEHNLAVMKKGMGDLETARRLQESVLVETLRWLPDPHVGRLAAQASLAITRLELDDIDGAEALLQEIAGSMSALAFETWASSPREARAVVETAESLGLAEVIFLSQEIQDKTASSRLLFGILESSRLATSEAARSLGLGRDDSVLRQLRAETAVLRKQANDLVAGGSLLESSGGAIEEELPRLVRELDRVERKARQHLKQRGLVVSPVTAEVLAGVLPEGAGAVGYRRAPGLSRDPDSGRVEPTPDRLLAHLVLGDGSIHPFDLGDAEEIEELVQAWRSAVGKPIRGHHAGAVAHDVSARQAGEELRRRILDPVLEMAGAAGTLHLCLDDSLHLVPLDALPLESGYVGDRVRILHEVSVARLLAPSSERAGAQTLLVFGGVDYDTLPGGEDVEIVSPEDSPVATTRKGSPEAGFAPLSETLVEASTVADLFEDACGVKGVVVTKEAATKRALHELAPQARFLHIASHGWFAPDAAPTAGVPQEFARGDVLEAVVGLAPLTLCGIALAGANIGRDETGRVPGILTAEELCSVDLSACDLAVLSACETNVGIHRAGQGIRSLQEALHAAGARSSITSLWRVDDAATRRFFELFYTKLWGEQLGKADALWKAKAQMREERYRIRDWAGWVLTGDPN